MKSILATLLVVLLVSVSAFIPISAPRPSTELAIGNFNDPFRRQDRASRQADSEDRVVELVRPLGLVLNDDDQGNVYVETVAPRGNAARSGMVCVVVGSTGDTLLSDRM